MMRNVWISIKENLDEKERKAKINGEENGNYKEGGINE
jgi:hypothetical protein